MASAYIIIEPESPDDPVLVYQLETGCYVVGRNAKQVDIPLVAKCVSRRHALLFVEEERVLIQDENSTKGVTVDGKRISPLNSVPIEASNNVMVGEFLLYTTDKLEGGVKAKKLKPKIYKGVSAEELKPEESNIVDADFSDMGGEVDKELDLDVENGNGLK